MSILDNISVVGFQLSMWTLVSVSETLKQNFFGLCSSILQLMDLKHLIIERI